MKLKRKKEIHEILELLMKFLLKLNLSCLRPVGLPMAVGLALAWPYLFNGHTKCVISYIFSWYKSKCGFFFLIFTYKRIFAQPHLPSIAILMRLVDMTEPTQ